MTPPAWTSRSAEIVVPPRREDFLAEELDGELILFDPRTSEALHLNRTAYTVWKLCDGTATTRQIADTFTAEYDVSPDRALDDVEQMVASFAESGLLRTRAVP